MAALTENALIEYRRTGRLAIPVAGGVEIFKGAHVNVRGGYAVPAEDEADDSYAGFAEEPADNTDGEDGDLTVIVNTIDELLCTGAGFAQTDVGADVFILDDATVGLAADSTNLVKVGKISEFVSTTEVWVDQRRARQIVVPQELADPAAVGVANGAIAALTFTAGGATGPEVEALQALCETLRDDVAALQGTVADLVTALKAAGVGILVDPA